MNKNKYIKLSVQLEGQLVFYEVLETKNIDFVEPGYVYQTTRPKTFRHLFEPGYLKDVEVHLILEANPQRVKLSWDSESSAIGLTTPRNESLELTYSGEDNYSSASTIAEAINNVSDSCGFASNIK